MTELIVALLVLLLAFEAKAWFPSLLREMIDLATLRLPRLKRDRFREEWTAHLRETPGAIVKLWQACGFVWASGRMFPRWRRAIAHRRFMRRSDLAGRITHRILDLAFVIPGLIFLAPVILPVALILKLDGPVFTVRRRMGRDGVFFDELRFRAHPYRNSESPFYSRFGYWLRITALDELPQLINVLKSEMSVVGPRSHVWLDASHKPGLSGLFVASPASNPRKAKSVLGRIALTIVFYFRVLIGVVRFVLHPQSFVPRSHDPRN